MFTPAPEVPFSEAVTLSEPGPMEIVDRYVDDVRAFENSSNTMARELHAEILALKEEMGVDEDPGRLHESLMTMVDRLEGATRLQKGSVDFVVRQLEESLNETADIPRHLDRAADLVHDGDASAADVLTEVGVAVDIFTSVMYGGRVTNGVLSGSMDVNEARSLLLRRVEGEIEAIWEIEDDELVRYEERLIEIYETYLRQDNELQIAGHKIIDGAGTLLQFIEEVVLYEEWLMYLFETRFLEDCGPMTEPPRVVLEDTAGAADAESLSP